MKTTKEPQPGTAFNPPIRIIDEGKQIHVSVDLPGIAEEQIRIDLEQTTCTLCILKNEQVLWTEFAIPRGVRFFRKKFSEGLLEIILEKTA